MLTWLTPLANCLPTFRLQPLALPEPEQGDDWFNQSRPRYAAEEEVTWDVEEGARSRRRQADLLSLHEGTEGRSRASSTRRTRHGRGDISGGGAVEGSGLSRTALFWSWWRGTRGRIRLSDGDDDISHDDDTASVVGEYNGEAGENAAGLFDSALAPEGLGEGDALPLSIDAVLVPPPASPTHSLVVSAKELERGERRTRRRMKRRAKELGLSLDEFQAGQEAASYVGASSPELAEGGGYSRFQSGGSRSTYSGDSGSTSTHSPHYAPPHSLGSSSHNARRTRHMLQPPPHDPLPEFDYFGTAEPHAFPLPLSPATSHSPSFVLPSSHNSLPPRRPSHHSVSSAHSLPLTAAGDDQSWAVPPDSSMDEIEDTIEGEYYVDEAGQRYFIPLIAGRAPPVEEIGPDEEQSMAEDPYAHIGAIPLVSPAVITPPRPLSISTTTPTTTDFLHAVTSSSLATQSPLRSPAKSGTTVSPGERPEARSIFDHLSGLLSGEINGRRDDDDEPWRGLGESDEDSEVD